MDLNVIIAYNGDQLANEAKMASANDNPDDLAKLNQRVQQANGILRAWVESHGGQAIAQTGNGGRLRVGADWLHELESILDQYRKETRTTVSVGIGAKLSEAEKALEYSVLTGGNSVELFTPELEARLGALMDPENEADLHASYLDKAEHVVGKFRDTRGGGIIGASKPQLAKPETPKFAASKNDEHSETEALDSFLAEQPPAPKPLDLSKQFGELADASEAGEASKKEEAEKQAEGDAADDEFKKGVVSVLKEFKEQAPLWEQLKENEPDAYKTLTDMMQVMIDMAKQMYSGDETEPVQKNMGSMGVDSGPVGIDSTSLSLAEIEAFDKSSMPMAAPLHGTVEGFLTALKGMPKEGHERGKFITQHMSHAPFLQAIQAHPQGKQVHAMLTNFLNSKANAGVGVGAKVLAKRSENDIDTGLKGIHARINARSMAKATLNPLATGTTGRHQVVLPPNSQLDPSASAGRKVGRIKILDPETQKTKWRQVRAGLVMDEKGLPISSRIGNK